LATESVTGISNVFDSALSVLPAILGALVILVIGWIAGRLVGKAVHIIFDRVTGIPVIRDSDPGKSVARSGITPGYLGDITARCMIYLVAILGATDLLKLRYLSQFMLSVTEYIPRVAAFVIILLVGLILTDYFIRFFQAYAKKNDIELIIPALFLIRIFLYFVVVMLALSQLMIDLTIIYTFLTPIAWGVGIGAGAAIAIVVWYGWRNKGDQIAEKIMGVLSK